ncbi:hypothetical protein [Anaerocolumna xylanovorans]|uniref:Uncharacterized protein n=1 Tax=Anaerocolumna xylanovorans DSM 12503 TaxID=1121345 RepID=A0A1M7YG24_9FIRM|nr:hypothetical protein [Anaerocolumna xylanovorans]SHO51563.1 hypothetical protein SAMN02745217_03258 [Anaerocolumna xylanovorans DSM 12503]
MPCDLNKLGVLSLNKNTIEIMVVIAKVKVLPHGKFVPKAQLCQAQLACAEKR